MNLMGINAWVGRVFSGLCLSGAMAMFPGAACAGSDYALTVALDATFDPEGRLIQLQPHEEAEQPAAFWAVLRERLAAMKIAPLLDAAGQTVGFRTGLYVQVQVKSSDGGGEVAIAGVSPGPLVLTRAFAGYPKDIAAATGWSGDVTARCTVGPQGQCGDVRVEVLPGMPDSVVRWARASLGLWRFRLPEVNGVAVSAPVTQNFHLQTSEDLPVDFRQRGAGDGAWMRR